MSEEGIPAWRNRLAYAVAVGVVIGTGLVWRSGLIALPNFVAKYGGDALWALVVFLCLGFVFHRSSPMRIALAAVCFAWAIEFLQLYHGEWIDAVRSTRPGQLLLGSTFNSPDLIAYVIGIALGAFVERVYFCRKKRS
jgi:hypothetical protein